MTLSDQELTILSVLKPPVAVLDKDRRVTFSNSAFDEISGVDTKATGLSIEEMLEDATPLSQALSVSHSVSGSIPCRLVFRGVEAGRRFSISRIGKDGDVSYLLQAMQRGTDQFVELNNQVRSLNEALAKEVQVARKYRATNEGIEHFLRKLIHDIRSPLSSIVSASALAKEDMEDGDYGSLREMLDMTEASARRLMALTERLYEDLQSKRTELKLESVSISSLVDELKLDLADAIAKSGARIECSGEFENIQADPVLLRELLQNLIQNSIKFRSESRPLVITVALIAGADGAREIMVEDNGVGFDSSMGDALFERFYRVNPDDGDGLGLGLSTCRQIAELHGWTISASGQVDKGASFRLTLS